MESTTCVSCRAEIDALQERCGGCGFKIAIEPDEARRARELRVPALGALLFTQGWLIGARLYLLALFSFIPIVGFVMLAIGLIFGRRLSWKYGGWKDWEEFRTRMRVLDVLGVVWVAFLLAAYFLLRQR